MYKFGKASKARLNTCRPELIEVAREVIKLVDFSVIHGYRSKEQQNLIYEQGFSKLQFPKSKHNKQPSDALDFIPFPLDWNDLRQFTFIGGLFLGVGLSKGFVLRWGGDWNKTGKLKENKFNDLGHVEFVRYLGEK